MTAPAHCPLSGLLGPPFELAKLPVEESVAALVPLDLALEDILLAAELPPLHIHVGKRDSGADDDDAKPGPGPYGCPRSGAPGCVPREASRTAEH